MNILPDLKGAFITEVHSRSLELRLQDGTEGLLSFVPGKNSAGGDLMFTSEAELRGETEETLKQPELDFDCFTEEDI